MSGPPDGGYSDDFGAPLAHWLIRFQHAHDVRADGVYGPATHRELRPFFDARGAHLMALPTGPSLRQGIVNEATFLYNARDHVHYEQFRPMQSLDDGHRLPQTMDCSENATVCYKRAGAPDPNGLGYNGLGYTGTLARQGRAVTLNEARPGDLVLYGEPWPHHHVAVYVGFGRVISHGSESGPLLLPVDYRSDRAMIRSYLP